MTQKVIVKIPSNLVSNPKASIEVSGSGFSGNECEKHINRFAPPQDVTESKLLAEEEVGEIRREYE